MPLQILPFPFSGNSCLETLRGMDGRWIEISYSMLSFFDMGCKESLTRIAAEEASALVLRH